MYYHFVLRQLTTDKVRGYYAGYRVLPITESFSMATSWDELGEAEKAEQKIKKCTPPDCCWRLELLSQPAVS